MSSSKPPFRQPDKQDPVDAMLGEWRQIKATNERNKPHEAQDNGFWPPLAQLDLMILLLKRP